MNRPTRNTLFGMCLCLTFAGMFSCAAKAQILAVDGNLLVRWCDTNINQDRVGDWAMKGGTCMGYLTAIANLQMSGAAVAGQKSCIPTNADMNQVVDVFRRFLKDNPEKRHFLATDLAATAFAQAFPCQQKRK